MDAHGHGPCFSFTHFCYGRILFASPRASAERNVLFFLMRRGRRLRGMSYAERRSHVVQIWQTRKKGEYDLVKDLKYNHISIYFFCECESAIISILSMKYMHLCLLECQWNTP